jgi:hypothetical protein
VKWILLSLILATTANANISKAPQNFKLKNGEKAVFVDFKRVDSEIIYDFKSETVSAITTIEFENFESGSPLFDLVPNVDSATLNSLAVSIKEISDPDNFTSYKMVSKNIAPGIHTLIIKNKFTTMVSFDSDYVNSAFFMSDLSDRSYIEKFIPANIEYDQYLLNLDIKLTNSKKIPQHIIYTNGVTTSNGNHFKISFPEYFTASSFYFHMTKKGRLPTEKFNYTSISGRIFPVVIYAKSNWSLSGKKKKTISILDELEAKLGAWSHPTLTIYIAGQGGMEYSGATITSSSALGHELTHSYFARGVMPVDGNSGWMDEAIASWRDKGYKETKKPSFSSTSMSAHSQYRRSTDRKAYSQGANFMAYLNHELKAVGGLITFLKDMHTKYTHSNITTLTFKKELESFSGRDFTKDFNQYIFGKKNIIDTKHLSENPYHPKLTEKQLYELL